MRQIEFNADDLCLALLGLATGGEPVCILDSCGVGHLGSHLMIAGVRPVKVAELSGKPVGETLAFLESCVASDLAAIITVSYDFGLSVQQIETVRKESVEPDVFLALFDVLIIHDYDSGITKLVGNEPRFDEIEALLMQTLFEPDSVSAAISICSNFAKADYLAAIEAIKERIRSGDTYQTNLTHQITAELPAELTPETIFWRLRRDHPAPFAAFLKRINSTVVSASPERFFRIESGQISASPIKGTRPRGTTPEADAALRTELLESEKDRAENTMIVDLLRNDLGRVCKYGSVEVEKLCQIEEHPTLFHLVSTIRGELIPGISFADIMRAVFPCGSITGAPKIRTMKIIDELETASRGLSMGGIGYYVPGPKYQVPGRRPSWDLGFETIDSILDVSVAIRTMVVRENQAVFNVGGGIVIDSEPEKEYEETLTKAKAMVAALGIDLASNSLYSR